METNDLTMEPEILRAALVGYQIRLDEVERKIADVKGMLANAAEFKPIPVEIVKPLKGVSVKVGKPHPIIEVLAKQIGIKPKRQISPAGREAIAAATKKRWRAWRKAQKNKAA